MNNNYQQINDEQKIQLNGPNNYATVMKMDAYKKNIKPRWWENVPLFGAIAYSIRIKNNFDEIGGQILDKNVATKITKWLMILLIIGFFIIDFLTPWFSYAIIMSALNKTKQQIIAVL